MWANWVAIARNQHFLATDMPRVTRASAGLRVPTAIALLLCALSALLLPSPAAMALNPDAWRTGSTASAGVASPSLTTEYTPEEVDDLVAPMDEREVRALFIEQLKTDAGGWPAMVRGIGVLLMLATAGLIAQRSISRQLPAITAKLSAAAMDHWLGRAGCLLARLLMEAASVGVFAPPARVSSASPSALALKNWSRISSRESFS